MILAIETSNPSAWRADGPSAPGVAVGVGTQEGVETLAVEVIEPGAVHDDQLMVAVERAVKRAGGVPRDVARVGVSAGPGGFTAVRIAVVAAKMIAEATGADCVPVPTADIVARRRPEGVLGAFAVALASKGSTAYAVCYGADGERPRGCGLIDASALAGLGIDHLIGDRYLPEGIRGEAARLGITVSEPEFDPVACLELAARMPAADPADVLPIYPREPEAVTKWRTLHGR